MPIFPLKCLNCNNKYEALCLDIDTVKEKAEFHCPECGSLEKETDFANLLALPDPWKPITLEHIATKPMRFETRKDLTKYCRKKGLASSALL